MSDRFYADSDFDSEEVLLAGAESHHLAHVLRKSVGESVTLFNGRGREAVGEIVAANSRETTLRVTVVRDLPSPPGPHVTLAVAVPKGERFRWLVEKAVELGVRRVIPLITSRSVVTPGTGKLQKVRRRAVEAGKQCGASHLPDIDEPTSWSELLQGRQDSAGRLVIAHPGGEPLATACGAITAADSLCFLIGPEGGFTQDEVSQAIAAGAAPVDLGSHILRVETTAIALAAFARFTGQVRMTSVHNTNEPSPTSDEEEQRP